MKAILTHIKFHQNTLVARDIFGNAIYLRFDGKTVKGVAVPAGSKVQHPLWEHLAQIMFYKAFEGCWGFPVKRRAEDIYAFFR